MDIVGRIRCYLIKELRKVNNVIKDNKFVSIFQNSFSSPPNDKNYINKHDIDSAVICPTHPSSVCHDFN